MSDLEYGYTLWTDGLPVRSTDGLTSDQLAVELSTMLDTDAQMARALAVTAEPMDVAVKLADGSQLEVGSRPL